MIWRSSTISVAATKKPTSTCTAPVAMAIIAATRIKQRQVAPAWPSDRQVAFGERQQPKLRQRARELALPPLQHDDVARCEAAVAQSRAWSALPGAAEREQIDLVVLPQMQICGRVADQQRVRRDHRLDGLQHIVLVARLQCGDFLGAQQLQLRLVHHRLQRGRIALQHQDVVRVQRPVRPRHVAMRMLADDAGDRHLAIAERLEIGDGLADQRRVLRQRASLV